MALNKLLASLTGNRSDRPSVYPLDIERRLTNLHSRAPVDRHLDILYRDVRIGNESYAALYRSCLERTGTAVTPFNVFHRFQNRLNLLQYFFATLDLPGARAECGVYRGATALLVCHAWRARQAAFSGDGYYLIDSFSGTSVSTDADLICVQDGNDIARKEAFFPAGRSDTSPDLVRGFFAAFPNVKICSGWIPAVFATLPERDWSFVHLDVTLYEPTLQGLEYFYPRLNSGGVIVCDGSIFCPGVEKAVDAYCASEGIPYVVMGNSDFVILKQ